MRISPISSVCEVWDYKKRNNIENKKQKKKSNHNFQEELDRVLENKETRFNIKV